MASSVPPWRGHVRPPSSADALPSTRALLTLCPPTVLGAGSTRPREPKGPLQHPQNTSTHLAGLVRRPMLPAECHCHLLQEVFLALFFPQCGLGRAITLS